MEDIIKALVLATMAAAQTNVQARPAVPQATKVGGIDVYLVDSNAMIMDQSITETARLVRSIANEVSERCRTAWSDSQRKFILDMHKSSKRFHVVGFGANKLTQQQFDHVYNSLRIGAVRGTGRYGVGATDLAGNTYVAYPHH